MNKAKFSTTIVLLLLLLPILALAAPSITETSVKVIADYGKFVDEDDDFIVANTQTFTVDNTDGTAPVTVKVTGLPSGYNSGSTTVAVGATFTGTLNIEIPQKNEPGEEKIGTIEIAYSNGTPLDTADLVQETLSMLDLSELEVKYTDSDGKSQKDEFASDDNKYTLENNVKPYTEMIFTFDLQNLFDRDYQDKGELEELELTVDVDDEDLLVEGFEDTYQLENIQAGRSLKQTVTLMLNQEVEPDTYTLEFTITAEDSEGIQYEVKKEVTLEVELDDDDIRIVSAKITPENPTICDKEVTLTVDVHNFGSDDQDKVKVTLVNTELKLNEMVENIAIDAHTEDDDSWTKTYTIPFQDVKAKTYFLDLKTFIGSNKLTDVKVAELVVKSCVSPPSVVEEEEEEQEETPVAEPQNETTEKPSTGITGAPIKSVEKLFYTSNDYLLALMLMAISVSAAMVILLLIILFSNNTQTRGHKK